MIELGIQTRSSASKYPYYTSYYRCYSPGAWHPGVWSQVGLRRHYYKKAGGSNGTLAELFQIRKDYAVKMLHSKCQQIWKTQQWPQNWKRWVFIPIPKKGDSLAMPKNVQTTIQLHSFHMLARLCSKSFKIGFSSTPKNFEMYQLGSEKAEEPEIKLPTIIGSWKKQGNSRKKIHPLLPHWLH